MAEHPSKGMDKGEEFGLGTKHIKGGMYHEINEGNANQSVTDEKTGSGMPTIEKNNPMKKGR